MTNSERPKSAILNRKSATVSPLFRKSVLRCTPLFRNLPVESSFLNSALRTVNFAQTYPLVSQPRITPLPIRNPQSPIRNYSGPFATIREHSRFLSPRLDSARINSRPMISTTYAPYPCFAKPKTPAKEVENMVVKNSNHSLDSVHSVHSVHFVHNVHVDRIFIQGPAAPARFGTLCRSKIVRVIAFYQGEIILCA